MALSNLFELADLETAMGGAYRLVQLAKATDTSDARYATFIALVRQGAQGDAYGRAKIAFDPLDSTVPNAGLLRSNCLLLAVYWAWSYGSGGEAIPDGVSQNRTQAIALLRELRSGEATLDTEDDPASNAGAKLVDLNSSGRVSRRNMGAFC